jgi:hypothetical protein
MSTNKKRNAATDERTFLERYAMWSHRNPLLALTCIVLVAVGCILTVVLNDELQFVETNDREWVILKDGITSSADAAAEGTRLVEEYVRIRLLLSRRASRRILTFSVDPEDVWGMSKFYLVGVYSFFSRKIDSSSDENEQKRKDKASSFPLRRDACALHHRMMCVREIKREFFDKFPLKRKEGRFCCLERCEGKGLTFYTYILYIISKNFTTTQVFILGCDLRARRGVAERLSVFPIRQ